MLPWNGRWHIALKCDFFVYALSWLFVVIVFVFLLSFTYTKVNQGIQCALCIPEVFSHVVHFLLLMHTSDSYKHSSDQFSLSSDLIVRLYQHCKSVCAYSTTQEDMLIQMPVLGVKVLDFFPLPFTVGCFSQWYSSVIFHEGRKWNRYFWKHTRVRKSAFGELNLKQDAVVE